MAQKYNRQRVDSEQRLAEELVRFLLDNPSDDSGEAATIAGTTLPPPPNRLEGVTIATLFVHLDRKQQVTVAEIEAALERLKGEGFISEPLSGRYSLTKKGTEEAKQLKR